jgi:hypothetical protein
MNYSSLESAPLFQENGIGKESEFVWVNSRNPQVKKRNELSISFKYEDEYSTIIGPAMVCEELGVELWRLGVTIIRSFYINTDWVLYLNKQNIWCSETIKAANEAEAREKALRWYLKRRGQFPEPNIPDDEPLISEEGIQEADPQKFQCGRGQ